MTKVVVDPGICGFTARIEVSRIDAETVSVVILSDCEMVSQWGAQLGHLDCRKTLKPPESIFFFESAFRHISHAACPIPVAVLKALEVEVGAAARGDVSISFRDVDPQ